MYSIKQRLTCLGCLPSMSESILAASVNESKKTKQFKVRWRGNVTDTEFEPVTY